MKQTPLTNPSINAFNNKNKHSIETGKCMTVNEELKKQNM